MQPGESSWGFGTPSVMRRDGNFFDAEVPVASESHNKPASRAGVHRPIGLDHRGFGQAEASQAGIRSTKDALAAGGRVALERADHRGGTLGCLQPLGGADRRAALVGKKPDADRLRGDECSENEKRQLAQKAMGKQARHVASRTSAARL